MKTLVRMVVAAAASVLVFDVLVRLGAGGEGALAVAILVACVVFAALGRPPRWEPTPLLEGEAPVDNASTYRWDDVLRFVRAQLGYWPGDGEADGSWLRKGTTGPFGGRDVPYGWPERSWWHHRNDADGGDMFVLEALDLQQDEVTALWSGCTNRPAQLAALSGDVAWTWYRHWKHEARCLRAGDDVRIEWHIGSHVATARSRASKPGGPKVLVSASVVAFR